LHRGAGFSRVCSFGMCAALAGVCMGSVYQGTTCCSRMVTLLQPTSTVCLSDWLYLPACRAGVLCWCGTCAGFGWLGHQQQQLLMRVSCAYSKGSKCLQGQHPLVDRLGLAAVIPVSQCAYHFGKEQLRGTCCHEAHVAELQHSLLHLAAAMSQFEMLRHCLWLVGKIRQDKCWPPAVV
jgi:hypothetical protein